MTHREVLLSSLPPGVRANVGEAVHGLQQAIATAYVAGRKEGIEIGRASMREAIMKAAQAPIESSAMERQLWTTLHSKSTLEAEIVVERAPRGAVRDTIVAALKARPGLTEKQLAAEMERINPLVSGRSAGGELRRLRGRIYRHEGGRWFLMKEHTRQAEMPVISETAEPQGSAVKLNQTTLENSDASETAIAT